MQLTCILHSSYMHLTGKCNLDAGWIASQSVFAVLGFSRLPVRLLHFVACSGRSRVPGVECGVRGGQAALYALPAKGCAVLGEAALRRSRGRATAAVGRALIACLMPCIAWLLPCIAFLGPRGL